ncbi:T9SS type B sorting domain-containing protein [Porticoccaceae bacterium]|nr:T9SS type B sorting domain-containing protein [Porticoccaceae bacterium]
MFTQNIQAQLGFCSGNSGDPIFIEPFGTGATIPLPPPGTTSYTYASMAPNDGFYNVSSNTDWFGWHNIVDHTIDDANGRMLVVNAEFTPGEFYRRTINGLCEVTTYQFSSWLINLLPSSGCASAGIPVNVKFEITDLTGTVLASGDTGNIFGSAPTWRQYGLIFKTLPGQDTVILKMINNGEGGCGNDLAIDDIVFKSCGDLTEILDAENNIGITICRNQTPYPTTLTAIIPANPVFTSRFYQWQESSDGINWGDIVGERNPSISISGITNTSYYRTKVSESNLTVNRDRCNTLSDVYTVTVDPIITPTFTQVPPICNGDSLSTLATNSNEGISGAWSPTLNNTVTTTYTFTPDAGECATNQNMTITVNPMVNPTFTQVAPICIGDSLSALPATSNGGITGTWRPSLDNTITTTYTFTPDTGQCATIQTMTILVNTEVTPSFTQVSAICSGDSLSALPAISIEGILGTWSPVLDNTSSKTYTFTPDAGQCASNQTMTITVNPIITPTFNQVTPICINDVLNPLPITSNEGITGTWSPAVDNTLTTPYTFTPDSGQCAINQMMTITVNPNQAPVFNPVLPICNGETLAPLPTISLNGIPGTWSPDLNNTVTKTYTFIPDAGFCPSTFNLTITVNDNPSFSLQEEYFLCFEQNGDLAFPTIIDTGFNPSMYNFRWLLNGLEISGAYQGTYSPIEGGSYEVVVQNNLTGCSSMEVTDVIPLYQPEFEAEVITAAFSENQTIQVSTMSSGDFEYQLDDNPWQDEPFFDNVSIGEHNVKVRDKRGCIESDDTIVVMGYPKFFTPNNDGYNDTWNIVAPTSPINYLASARIFIFNRFGKLLKELNPSGEGWKGIYNGVTMPNDDYWFIVEYTEPNSDIRKQFKSHFTLKR